MPPQQPTIYWGGAIVAIPGVCAIYTCKLVPIAHISRKHEVSFLGCKC
ncbi:hypothetical protein U128_01395 [Anaplasma marginale str. Gypsy Plains]|nr:hypothetical protein U128_01395 [Anaplasma marginale str. Gypsy Plains]